MKRYLGIFIMLVIFACQKEDTATLNDIVTIYSDSIYLPNQSQGFSIAEETIIEYPNSLQIIPDFRLLVEGRKTNGRIIYSYASFKSLMSKPTFVFIDSLASSDLADSTFINFASTDFKFQAERTYPHLEPNQLWLVKSIENTYYKILILEVEITQNPNYESGNGQNPLFSNVTFKWKTL